MTSGMRAAFLYGTLLCLIIGVSKAEATTFILPRSTDLVAGSDAVVLGYIRTIRSVEDGAKLRTNVVVGVEETVKGAGATEITVVEPGGLVGDRHRWIFGAPTFFVGERVLLFLQRNRRHELETTFLGIGKFSVVRSNSGKDFAVRTLRDARVLVRGGRRLKSGRTVTTHLLEDFVKTLRAAAASRTPQPFDPRASATASGSRWQDNFTFAGPPHVRWFLPDDGQPIAYLTSGGGDAALGADASVAAADAALAAWSSTPCANLTLVDSGTADPSPYNACDGRTEITFNDPFSELPDPIDCTGVLGIGGVCADSSTPESFNGGLFDRITEGDVIVNNGFDACPFWTDVNLAELLTHEVGHTLGLGHSSEDPNESDPSLRDATMYYAAHFDGRGATLMSDDIAAICALYPTGRTASVALRRFAILSDATGSTPVDRLAVDGTLSLESGHFDPQTETLIIDMLAAGSSVFHLAVLPGQWMTNVSGTRFYYRGVSASGTTTLMLAQVAPGSLRFSIRARGMDLSDAQTNPVVMSLALGEASVTQPVPTLRISEHGRVFP